MPRFTTPTNENRIESRSRGGSPREAADARAETLAGDATRLAQRLERAEATYHESLAALRLSAADDGGGERAVAAIETVNERWAAEIEALGAAHADELARVQSRADAQLKAYKASASTATQECSSYVPTSPPSPFFPLAAARRSREDRVVPTDGARAARRRIVGSSDRGRPRVAASRDGVVCLRSDGSRSSPAPDASVAPLRHSAARHVSVASPLTAARRRDACAAAAAGRAGIRGRAGMILHYSAFIYI